MKIEKGDRMSIKLQWQELLKLLYPCPLLEGLHDMTVEESTTWSMSPLRSWFNTVGCSIASGLPCGNPLFEYFDHWYIQLMAPCKDFYIHVYIYIFTSYFLRIWISTLWNGCMKLGHNWQTSRWSNAARPLIRNGQVALLAVDEVQSGRPFWTNFWPFIPTVPPYGHIVAQAHSISEWGGEFRLGRWTWTWKDSLEVLQSQAFLPRDWLFPWGLSGCSHHDVGFLRMDAFSCSGV